MKETSTVKLWSKNFVFIILINFLVFLNHIMLVSTFPFYIAKLGGSEAVSGTAATLFSLVAVIFRPFIGWMLDNGKRKAILIIGLCGMAVTPIGYLIFSVVYMALVCRMLHGASLAYSNTSTATIASDIIPQSRFAEGMGFFGMATALATACAPAFGLAIMDKMGFETLFLCATGSILIAFILLLLLKTPVIETVKKPFSLKGLVDKNALPASAVTVIFMLTFGALENFLAKYAADHGLPSGGIYFAIMSVMLFLTRISVGKIADREGEEIFVYTCNASMLSALLLLSFNHTTLSFVLSAVLAGYAFGGLEPALQSMAIHIAPPEKRGSANSTFLCAYDIGIGLGGGIAGWLIAGSGYHIMWFALSMANIVSVVVYLIFGRSHPSSFHYKKHT
ncbi:MAG: MFS transporter [Anaerotignum sp.]|nr:MFS transporter [Anaerotignum sp.]